MPTGVVFMLVTTCGVKMHRDLLPRASDPGEKSRDCGRACAVPVEKGNARGRHRVGICYKRTVCVATALFQ